MRTEKLLLNIPLFILFIALACFPVTAADIAGKIRGVVTDQSGAGVVGATVIARNAETSVETRVTTAEGGSYSTITDLSRLEKEYRAVRENGYATDREEAVAGAFCIGAPVRDHTGEVVAAVSVSMMVARVAMADEPRLINIVTQTASKISAALGG